MLNRYFKLLTIALCLTCLPVEAHSQWAEQFGLHCPGRWVNGGTMCQCHDGGFANYVNGQVVCPSNQGFYQPTPQSWCPVDHYEYGDYCVPVGDTVCYGSGGARSCPSHLKCTYDGACIPHDATDCGNGNYCSSGRFCWTDPQGVPNFEAGTQRCLTSEQFDAYNYRMHDYYAQQRRAEEDRSEQARVRALEEQREAVEEQDSRLNDDADRQVQRLTRLSSTNDSDSPEAIMRRLREDSVLERLRLAEGRQQQLTSQQAAVEGRRQLEPTRHPIVDEGRSVVTRQPIAPNGMPPRQTPAPRYALPHDRETVLQPPINQPRTAPSPSQAIGCSVIDGQTICSGDPEVSWVQDFAIGGSPSIDDLPSGARDRAEADRLRAQYEEELQRIELETRRSQRDAFWDALLFDLPSIGADHLVDLDSNDVILGNNRNDSGSTLENDQSSENGSLERVEFCNLFVLSRICDVGRDNQDKIESLKLAPGSSDINLDF